jgi:hypothetical protein
VRRVMIVLAIATTLAAGSIGHAEGELATCKGSAPGGKSCAKTFTITEPMAVNLRLAPEVGYTGSIMARIQTMPLKGPVTGGTVGGYYVAGQATPIASNLVTETTVMLSPGDYRLLVEPAKILKPCSDWTGCADDVPQGDGFAAGGFAAEVIPTDSVV